MPSAGGASFLAMERGCLGLLSIALVGAGAHRSLAFHAAGGPWGQRPRAHPQAAFLSPDRQAKVDEARRLSGFRASHTALFASQQTFESKGEYYDFLAKEGPLPQGFKVGTAWIAFTPVEANFPSRMNVTIIALDEPTDKFAAAFTKNAAPGAPVRVGRKRVDEKKLQAVVINNKISNVCPGGQGSDAGVGDAEMVCEAVAKELGLPSGSHVIPSSTGVIGWRLPYQAIIDVLPAVKATLQSSSIMPAARGIVTTDRYPKIRSAVVGKGRIVAIGKGAGMIEPNLATMLVYILTDIAIPRDTLRSWLPEVVSQSFNCISIDSDTSTSDTVLALSSGKVPLPEAQYAEAKEALMQICKKLAEDIVRNGEGTNHVMELRVVNAPSLEVARGVGKAVINSPLLKCAIAGNDPNVGRMLAAVGKWLGANNVDIPVGKIRLSMGGELVFGGGQFQLSPDKEKRLVAHMEAAQIVPGSLKASAEVEVPFPPHERNVVLEVDLGQPQALSLTLFGSDLTYGYVAENADYRS